MLSSWLWKKEQNIIYQLDIRFRLVYIALRPNNNESTRHKNLASQYPLLDPVWV